MKQYLLTAICLTVGISLWAQPCTTTDASGCICADGSDTCDLLPNIKLSHDLLADPTENPETPGLLRVSVGTPNLGHGPLTVKGTSYFVCNTDTIYSPGGLTACPNGQIPRQLVKQIIYRKEGNTMTNYERWAASMTYHPTHGHSHFDDWGVYTLRIDNGDPNPLNWPIIGSGAKLGFCLMDYGTCSFYNGYCRDDQNNIVTNNLPNYGLGGGNYNCSPTQQGISVGYTDIYYQYLDGMYITIPPGTCNGNYKIVVQVDPHNALLEENDNDNVMVADITLTQQTASNNTSAPVSSNQTIQNGSISTCNLQDLELSVPQTGSAYLWSNGNTNPTMRPASAGSYSCTITTPCGDQLSDTITVIDNSIAPPIASDLTICENTYAILSATANPNANINWYDANGNFLSSGSTYTTPTLSTTTSYYVESTETVAGGIQFVGHDGTGATSQSSQTPYGLNFSVYSNCTLKSVLVKANTAGSRTIQVKDNNNNIVHSTTINVGTGDQRLTLNFPLTAGDYSITSSAYPDFQRIGQSANLGFPYSIANVLDITSSTFQNSTMYYHYYFDWEVQLADETCRSTRDEVRVITENCGAATTAHSPISEISLTPNPAQHSTTLRLNADQQSDLNISILDALGRVLHTQNAPKVVGKYQTTIDISNLSDGVYMIQIRNKQGIDTQRLVVKH